MIRTQRIRSGRRVGVGMSKKPVDQPPPAIPSSTIARTVYRLYAAKPSAVSSKTAVQQPAPGPQGSSLQAPGERISQLPLHLVSRWQHIPRTHQSQYGGRYRKYTSLETPEMLTLPKSEMYLHGRAFTHGTMGRRIDPSLWVR